MVKNFSSSQKTVKNTIVAAQNDTWVIDKILLYANYMNLSILPSGTVMDDYYDYFESLTVEVEVPEKFYYSPSGFAEYYYGDAGLDFLVLYFAKIPSLFEFNKPKITVFPVEYLKEFNKMATFKKKEVIESKNNPKEYTKFRDVVNQTQAYEDYFRL